VTLPFPFLLTANDYREMFELATERNDKSPEIPNRRITPKQSDLEINFLGTRSELAVATFLAVDFDRRKLVAGDGGRADIVWRGIGVEVKSTTYRSGVLFFPTVDKFTADVAFLCHVAAPRVVNILGWIDRDTFQRVHFVKPINGRTCAVVTQGQLFDPREIFKYEASRVA
jgi:hypothetical protein